MQKTSLQQATEEYKQLFFKKYGVKLSDTEANKRALGLINLFRVLRRPLDSELTIENTDIN
jgi:predicted metalloenzyme YecM